MTSSAITELGGIPLRAVSCRFLSFSRVGLQDLIEVREFSSKRRELGCQLFCYTSGFIVSLIRVLGRTNQRLEWSVHEFRWRYQRWSDVWPR